MGAMGGLKVELNRNTGQVTVFLSIILLAVIIVAGVLVDASRISSGEALAKSAVSSAAKSVLAGYGSRLKENYGLLAFNSASEESLKNTVKAYLEKNLQAGGEKENGNPGIDLYGFRIENINVSAVQNLSENKVFKQQILEYMKYRAPKEMVEGFVERLSAVRDMGKMSAAYSRKIGIDKLLGKLDKAQQSLKSYIDGSGKEMDKYINGFNLNGVWQNTFSDYLRWNTELKEAVEALEGVSRELGQMPPENNRIDASDKKDRIGELESLKSSLTSRISSLDGKINEAWNNLRYSLTEEYTAPNEKAVKDIDRIVEAGKRAEELISGLESFLDGNFTGESDFVGTLREELGKLKGVILKGRQAAEMIKSLENNSQVLNQLVEKLELFKEQRNAEGPGLSDSILELVSEYDNQIEYSYEKPEKGEKADDPRKDTAKELKDSILQKVFDDRNLTGSGIVQEELPSKKKVASRSFDEEDLPYIGEQLPADSVPAEGKSAGYQGDLGNITGEADLYDEESVFQENVFGFTENIGNMLEGGLTRLRDNIYINEYIMGMFKNHVPVVKKDGNNGTFTFLNGISRDSKDTFFECEVEYILHGNSSEITNRALTGAQILLLRLGANTLHVYTDAKKRQLSAATATAVAGWWTGGAGIPVISNLIMCAWGMGEALIDLEMLMSGEAVPIYKSPGDWKLDIGLPKATGPKTDAKLYFSYHDYLRLFLLAMDEEEKLGRTEDLIEINTGLKKPGFKAGSCNTFIRVEAEISMKNLFLSRPFMPESAKTGDGRRKIRVLVYEGY